MALVLAVAATLEASPALQTDPVSSADTANTGDNGDQVWSSPVNLSRSGAAEEPQLVRDAQGRFHIIWKDAVNNEFIYTQGSGDHWSEPLAVELPFATRRFFPDLAPEQATPLYYPLLVADARGRIHAFWIDDVGTLFQSWVPASDFANFEAWTAPLSLAEGALAVDAILGPGDTLHLTYIRILDTVDLPAGVYYQKLSGNVVDQPISDLLYQSDYFRSLTRERANVQIASSESGQVFVAWDNWPLERVFLTRSSSDGSSWDPPQEVDSRTAADSPDLDGPANIILGTNGSNVLALWTAAHEGLSCALYYRWSSNGGDTWEPNQRLEMLQGCPEKSQLLSFGENHTLLMTAVGGITYLVAWDGQKWSRADAQDSLSVFLNTETYKQVHFGCQQAVIDAQGMYVVGCDASGGRDIWLRSRQLGAIEEWFPPPPVWTTPQAVDTNEIAIESPVLVSDADGRLHTFWARINGPEIYHTVWDGVRWSQPRTIFTSPTSRVGELAVTVDYANRLLLTWGDVQTGQIYLIQAEADQAILASNWSLPKDLPQPESAASWPDIIADQSGRIYLCYAIPVNEGRGIYLTWSDDNGESWMEPVTVFDGAASGWVMAGGPRMALTESGQIHILWTRHALPAAGPIALFYAHSADGGRSWSEPAEITEVPVAWSEIAGLGEGTVHLIWQEASETSTILRHLLSVDGGVNFGLPTTVSGVDGEIGPVAVTVDGTGRLHLLYGTMNALHHWLWNGERWERVEDPGLDAAVTVNKMAAAAVSGSSLGLVYLGQTTDADNQVLQDTLFFASRLLEGATASAETPQPAATVAAAPTQDITVDPSPSPPPAATTPAVLQGESQLPLGEQTALVYGILPAGLIVLIGFAVGLRVVRNGRR